MHPCPVCGEPKPPAVKTHPACWAEYLAWRDGPQRPLRESRLYPEDGGSWGRELAAA
jgi:hypothetical protein